MADEEFSIVEVEDWEPTLAELDAIYMMLEKGEMIELNWKCPGKRLPSPKRKEDSKPAENQDQKTKAVKDMEFDFKDDVALPQMRHRNQTPKSTAKKKTTNFVGVLEQMRKHGRLAATTTTPTPSASQTTVTSSTTTVPTSTVSS